MDVALRPSPYFSNHEGLVGEQLSLSLPAGPFYMHAMTQCARPFVSLGIYLRKVQNVLSFLPFLQPSDRKLSTPSVPSATPPNGTVEAMVKSVRGEAPRGVAGYATSKAPFARPSIKGVHHAGMHA